MRVLKADAVPSCHHDREVCRWSIDTSEHYIVLLQTDERLVLMLI